MSSKIPRLAYGFLSSSLEPINVKIPLQISNQDGMFRMNYLPEEAIKDSLIFWAKTNKGEYIMDTSFGLDIKRHLFSPVSYLKDNILQNAREQLPKYFPRLKIRKIEVLTKDDIPDISDNSVLFILEAIFISDKTKIIKIKEEIGF